jgi:hypothetical protein
MDPYAREGEAAGAKGIIRFVAKKSQKVTEGRS